MKVRVEIADTQAKLAKGLMYRDQLAEDAGMLFIFSHVHNLSFWGRNTFIPLDIAFIDKSGVIQDIGKIRKLSESAVRSRTPCLMALEVNVGFFERHGINVGDRIMTENHDGEWVVSFDKDAGTRGQEGEQQVKVAAGRKVPSVHPMLPFSQPLVVQKARPTPGNKPMKAVPKPTSRKNSLPNQMQLPFDSGFDNDLEETRAEMGDQRYQAQVQQEQQPVDQSLPEIGLEDIPVADDDIDDKWLDDHSGYWDEDGNEPEGEDPLQPDSGSQQGLIDDQENPGDLPDAKDMTAQEALKYAQDNGLVLSIRYTTLPKKTLSGVGGGITITRRIQPHGTVMAKTTGNVLEVCWDMSVGNFRAFVINRISDKFFTGEKFQPWFRVKQ